MTTAERYILAIAIVALALWAAHARANSPEHHAPDTRTLQSEKLVPNNPYPGTHYRERILTNTNRPPFKNYRPAIDNQAR